MTHPAEGTLQALLDDEVVGGERAELERHLVACGVCADELAQLRTASAGLGAALRRIDAPVEVEQARWRFEARRRDSGRGFGRGAAGSALRRAAVLIVGSAAVLSATVPGSPVREWLGERWERVATTGAEPAAPEHAPTIAMTREAADAGPSGVSVLPAEGATRVQIRSVAPGVQIRVVLQEGERAGVWASGEAAGARFRTAPGRIEADDMPAGEVRVEVPRSGERFTLEVNGRVYLVKQGEQLRFPGPAADTSGPEITFEVRP
jgi:hypothetical protein